MRLIIAGSRSLKNVDIGAVIKELGLEPGEIVSGGAAGIDSLAFDWALDNNIPVTRFLPDWKKYGRAAGPLRNGLMAQYGDALLAIWDGRSTGTKDMIRQAEKRGIPIYQRTIQVEAKARSVPACR